MKVSELAQVGDEYKGAYWEELDALYHGGEKLTRAYEIRNGRSAGVLTRILPRHTTEEIDIYQKRLERAVYINHSGSILNYLVAVLGQDQARIVTEDDWLNTWSLDVSNGRSLTKETLSSFMARQATDWLVFGISWALCDVPKVVTDVQPVSLGEQNEMGMRDAYVIRYSPLSVIDWEFRDGELIYAKTFCEFKRRGVGQVKEWTIYTPTNWERWEFVRTKDNETDTDPEATLVGQGPLTVMPMVCSRVETPLWLMDALRSVVGEQLRQRSNVAWHEANALIQDLWEFIDEQAAVPTFGDKPDDSGSSKTDNYGPGWVHRRKAGDRAEYISPKSDIYRYALESIKETREEVYRICYSQSLALGNSGAAMARSEGSRTLDKEAERVIVSELGRYAKAASCKIIETVMAMRGDVDVEDKFIVEGFEEFSQKEDDSIIDTAEIVERIRIPSQTFERKFKLRIAKIVLGPEATDEIMADIASELEDNIDEHSLPTGVKVPKIPFKTEQNVVVEDELDDVDNED